MLKLGLGCPKIVFGAVDPLLDEILIEPQTAQSELDQPAELRVVVLPSVAAVDDKGGVDQPICDDPSRLFTALGQLRIVVEIAG